MMILIKKWIISFPLLSLTLFSSVNLINLFIISLSLLLISLSLGIPSINQSPSLTHLSIYGDFNHPVDHLPISLRLLHIQATKFNQNVGMLPSSLTHLYFICSDFDKPLNRLPSSLIHFKFMTKSQYAHDINHLPSSLLYLSFTGNYYSTLDNLPPNLLRFTFFSVGSSCNHPIPLPSSLISAVIHLPKEYDHKFNLPPSLIHCCIGKRTHVRSNCIATQELHII